MPEVSHDESIKAGPSVGIVGLGLIGGSIGLAARAAGITAIGWDSSPSAQAVAIERSCVDRAVSLEEVAAADIVFVAAPPDVVVHLCEQVLAIAPPETVVTDCSSVKAAIAEFASRCKAPNFVGGHPMAGHEKSGASFASAWMFRGARWILTPVKSTSASAMRAVEAMVKQFGAVPIRIDAAEHDHHVAVLSHLPHVLAGLLVQHGAKLEKADVAAGSWRDLTRVGGVDPALWTQILAGNRVELAKVLRAFSADLDRLSDRLEADDREAVFDFLAQARAAKSEREPPAAASHGGPKPRRIGRRR